MRILISLISALIPICLLAQTFTDVTGASGLATLHDGNLYPDTLELGSGAAWIDANADGYPDVYVTMRLSANKLFINQKDGTFNESAASYGVADATGDGAAVAVADFNNDGFQDFFLANGKQDRLFKNVDGTYFVDISTAVGLDTTDQSRAVSATWCDYDNDGFVDLYIVNNSPLPGATNASSQDRLYNNSHGDFFVDYSSLLESTGDLNGNGYSAAWVDYDRDSDLDLIVTNNCTGSNPVPNQVFRNDGDTDPMADWNFTEVGVAVGLSDCSSARGIALGDYNRDGWVDLFYSNDGACHLYQNNSGVFTDISLASLVGIQSPSTHAWGATFLDIDLDGWLDLFLTCGSDTLTSTQEPQENMLFLNNANGTSFSNVSSSWQMEDVDRARNAIAADYDRDGDEDLLIVNYGEALQLKRNDRQNNNRSVTLKLQGQASNTGGIGSRIKLTLPDSSVQYRDFTAGANMGGTNGLELILGIGTYESASKIEVEWPSGITQIASNLSSKIDIQLKEPVSDNMTVSYVDVSQLNNITASCGEQCDTGGAVSFVDFDQDGWDDVCFGSRQGDSLLFYKNVNGTLVKIPPLVDDIGWHKQILWFDLENDGDLDLYIVTFFGQNRLFRNDLEYQFTEITNEAGLGGVVDPSFGATAGDFNNDGLLDLYVSNWSILEAHHNYLYKNNGNSTFTEVASDVGINDGYSLSLCAAFLDINHNGYQDIYVSVDRYIDTSIMYKNIGGVYSEISESSNTDLVLNAMNVGPGDYDQDGDLDIYVTNDGTGCVMLENNGNETFTDVAVETGVVLNKFSWGANFFDCDLDRDLDLYVSCRNNGPAYSSELFLNQIDQDTFIRLDPIYMVGDTFNSFSNCMGDLNHDGLPDIAVNNSIKFQAPNTHQVWKNTSTTQNHFLKINLVGKMSNRYGVGSWIETWIEGEKYVRYTHAGVGYASQNSYTEIIGLGTSMTVDSIKVLWLSGHESKLYNVHSDQTISIHESEVIYVDKDADGMRTGYTWENAFDNIHEALYLAGNSNIKEIWLKTGTYLPSLSDRYSSFHIQEGVKLYGGFSGNEDLLSERNPILFPTILSGNIGAFSSADDNSYQVLSIPQYVTNSLVDGIVIKDGNANGSTLELQTGGGVYCRGNLDLVNVSIEGCQSVLPGSSISLNGNQRTITLDGVTTQSNGMVPSVHNFDGSNLILKGINTLH